MREYRLTVGGPACGIRGFTNTHIQCAVDRVHLLGGGEVELSEGTFHMADALHLRSGVRVKGQGETTVLRKNAMKQAKVIAFLGFGHNDVIVDAPDVFEPGEGIIIGDERGHGFYQTTATLVRREGDAWLIDRAFAHDYTEDAKGWVKTLFPLISVVDEGDASVEDLAVDGNAAENDLINGCRGGGFFAHRSDRIRVRRVTVRHFNGEGFSFQTCDEMELDSCIAEQCLGNGFHPGSGSNRFHIHDCASRDNGRCGLFYCLRVRDGVLENCAFERNKQHGVFIGSRDTGHMNRGLVIRGNGGAGIYVVKTGKANAAHDNAIENCTLEHNAQVDGEAEIVLQGETEGVRVIGNRIRRAPGKPGILIKPEMPPFVADGNVVEPPGPDAIVNQRT